MKKFRVAILFVGGDIKSENFNTKDEADNYILEEAEKQNTTPKIKQYRILNRETKEIIERGEI